MKSSGFYQGVYKPLVLPFAGLLFIQTSCCDYLLSGGGDTCYTLVSTISKNANSVCVLYQLTCTHLGTHARVYIAYIAHVCVLVMHVSNNCSVVCVSYANVTSPHHSSIRLSVPLCCQWQRYGYYNKK